MAESRGAQLLELALEGGGGFAAGVIDTQYSDKKPLGLTIGLLAGAALSVGAVALGPRALGGMAGYLGDVGGGMLAFEAGMVGSNWRAGKKVMERQPKKLATPAAQGRFPGRARQIAGAPQAPQMVTRQDLYRSIAELGELQRVG